MGSTICTAGFPSAAIASSCFTARCDSIWYGFFIATLLFLGKRNCSQPIKSFERGSRYFLRSTGHSRAESASIECIPAMPTVAGPEVVRARRPLAFGAADSGYGRAEHLIEFSGRTHSPGPWLRRVPRDGTADLRQTLHCSAEFDLSEQTKVRVGDPIQMFLRRQPLVLACLE